MIFTQKNLNPVHNPRTQNINQEIVNALTASGLSIGKIATSLMVSPTTVKEISKGNRNNIQPKTFNRLIQLHCAVTCVMV